MRNTRNYRMLSFLMAFMLTFLSIDVSVFAVEGMEDVVEIQQEMPEETTETDDEVLELETESDVVVVDEKVSELETDSETENIAENEGILEFEQEVVIESELEGSTENEEVVETTDEELELQWIPLPVQEPVANIESGSTITEDTVIQLTSETLDAKIYYTTDGTSPMTEDGTVSRNLYVDGLKAGKIVLDSENNSVSGNSIILKAYAVKEGNIDSQVVTFEYAVENEKSRWGDILEEDRKRYATLEMPEGDASKVPERMWIAGMKEDGYTYTGSNIVFLPETENEIRVYDGKTLLKANRDYTISYKNNKKAYPYKEGDSNYNAAKAPTVILKGKGNYSGSITQTFVINPLNLSVSNNDGTPMFQAEDITLEYNGKIQKGVTKVTFINEAGKTVTLKPKTDFEYTYPDKDEVIDGEKYTAYTDAKETPYTVTIVGKGNYAGTLDVK